MPVTTGSKIQYEYMLGGGSPAVVTVPESSGQTFLPGAFLKLDSSGHTVKATTGDLATASHLALRAGRNSTADGDTSDPVLLLTPNTVLSGVCYHATTASAITSSTLFGDSWPLNAATDSGDECWVVSVASSGAGAYVIATKDATGTAYGRVYFLMSRVYEAGSPFSPTTGASA